jgi:anti-anti-sigma factor
MRTTMPVELKMEDVGNVLVIKVLTPRVRYEQSEEFSEQLRAAVLANRGKNILLNMEDVDYLTSDALGTLTGIHKLVAEGGGGLKLVIWNKAVRAIFRTTNLDKILDIHEDVNKAVISF